MTIIAGLLADEKNQDRFKAMEQCFSEIAGGEFKKTSTSSVMLDWVRDGNISFLVIDETIGGEPVDRSFLENVVRQNAMMNIVVAGSADKKRFHDETEGLGIVMQLSPSPGEGETIEMMEKLHKISGLLGTV